MSILDVRNISKKRKHTSIYTNINLKVEKGDCYAILGADNEGKTSVLNAIMGLDRPDCGEIYLFEENIKNTKNIKSIKKRIGYVPDDLLCFENMTGAELLDMTISFRNADNNIKFAETLINYFKINPTLQLQDMDDDMNKCTYIISAFLSRPELIILDEPFNFLSNKSIRMLKKLISAYTHMGNTVIIVHDSYDVVSDVCTKFSVIKEHKQLRCDESPSMYNDMKIIVADGIKNDNIVTNMLNCAKEKSCTFKVIKKDIRQTAMIFKGETGDLTALLNCLECENYEIRNVSAQAQIMEWYD